MEQDWWAMRLWLGPVVALLLGGCSSGEGVERVDTSGEIPENRETLTTPDCTADCIGDTAGDAVADGIGDTAEDDGMVDGKVVDGMEAGDLKLPDLPGVDGDGISEDTQGPPPVDKPCIEDNSEQGLAARDGFIEVCAKPAFHPNAVCGDGSAYKFSYRPAVGESKGLLLYFRGGGACDDYVSCWGLDGKGGQGKRVSTMSNDVNTAPGMLPALGKTLGIFYLNEATNPLRAYDQVHIAYCTGDAGLGTTQATLLKPSEADAEAPASITTYFHGKFDVLFALDRTQTLFPTPKRLVVIGSSAGSLASMGAVPRVVERWSDPTLPIGYFSEGGVGVGMPAVDQMMWETVGSFDGIGGKRLVRFAQFSFISDATQRAFASAAFQDASAFQAELRKLLEARAQAYPSNYRYFAVPGTCHTLSQNPALFQQFTKATGSWKPVVPAVKPNPDLSVGEANLLPWLTALIENDSVLPLAGNVAGDWEAVATECPVPGGN